MIYIICFFIIIVVYLLYKSYISTEPFTTNSNERSIILLGDSILKNNNYVKQVNNVEHVLREKINGPVYCFAKDGATITDVYTQINDMPCQLNNKRNIIFLSIGGNDMLKNKNKNINSLFQEYKRLVTELKKKFDKCRLVLLNLYTPPKINKIKNDNTVTDRIQEWNTQITEFINNNNNNNIEAIDLNKFLFEPTDFVSGYEPSDIGGHKIVNAILNKL